MMFRATAAIGTVLSALALAAPANAQESKPDRLRAADTDGDKRISREEFAAQFPGAREERFAALDRNNDGFLDARDRMKAAPAPKRQAAAAQDRSSGLNLEINTYLEKLLRANDADQDGRLTLAELTAAKHGFPPSVFRQLDRDKDGALTLADARLEGGNRAANDRANRTPRKQGARNEAAAQERVSMDVNGDKKITFDEAQQVNPNITRERFDARDTNGDGVLSKEDRKK